MKICMLHELDTGFMAATLKPAFEELGHDCVVMQGWSSHLENDTEHVDYMLSDMTFEDQPLIEDEFKDTDFFIIRAGDVILQDSGILPYLNKNNMIYRLHGHDLTALGRPYSLRAWRIDWHGNEPTVVTYNDPTFHSHYKSIPVYIERPINLDIIPKKKKTTNKFALSSPTSMQKKGGKLLMNTWNKGDIELKIISNATRDKVLELKSKASYCIDNLDEEYKGGPYGMNTVEAWIIGIPAFSRYTDMSLCVCPELNKLVHNTTLSTVQADIEDYVYDKKTINYAKQYAINTHSPINIATQYISLYKHISTST